MSIVVYVTTLSGLTCAWDVGGDGHIHYQVLAGTAKGSIFRLNIQTMKYIAVAESHTGSVVAVAFSTKYDDRFATASEDGTIR